MDDNFSQFACGINSRIEFTAFKCNNYKKFETSGDAELNSGPYEIIRPVRGSFNQVNQLFYKNEKAAKTSKRKFTGNARQKT